MTMPDAITRLKAALERAREATDAVWALALGGATQDKDPKTFDAEMAAARNAREAAWSAVSAAIEAVEGEMKRLREVLKARDSEDPMDRLVHMVLDLLAQRAEFERLAKEALDPRDAARRALQGAKPND